MKKIILIMIIICSGALYGNAQTQNIENQNQNTVASVEKSVFGVQTGFLGIWVHNEFRIANRWALRSEVGFESGIIPGDSYTKTGFIMAPMFLIEPRWYYNLKKRKSESRRIDGNSGNFISLETVYIPDWFVISNYENEWVRRQLWITPMWGIRRNIGNHFNYEAGIGAGYRIYIKENEYTSTTSELMLNIILRIGYRF